MFRRITQFTRPAAFLQHAKTATWKASHPTTNKSVERTISKNTGCKKQVENSKTNTCSNFGTKIYLYKSVQEVT